MKSDGKRFHQAQLFQGKLSGIQFFSWQHNEFGKGAIPLHTESLVELASVRTSAQTRRALAAVRVWGHRYVRPRRQCASRPGSSTTVADTSWPRMRGYVTSGLSPRNEFRSLPQNPTHADPEQHGRICGYRISDGLEIGLTRFAKHERPHVCTPWKIIGKVIDVNHRSSGHRNSLRWQGSIRFDGLLHKRAI